MANTLSVYDPIFYANEALIQLEKNLGMAGRVHRGYDKNPQERGSTISIKKPSTFTAQDAPSTAQDINASNVDISLSYWREVKFKLTDKELSFTGEEIIEDHIRPAAYALADDIDQKLALLYKDIPWFTDVAGTPTVADITAARQVLVDNNVPMEPGRIHGMLNGSLTAEMLNISAFTQNQGSGAAGVQAQLRGALGTRYGIDFFENQNVQSHTPGVSADAAGALTAAAAKGATTIAFDGVTIGGTFKAGDSFVLAGNTQRYVFTADATADGGGAVASASIFPALVQAHADNDVITISLDSHAANLVFHRNAFALAMAPLPTNARELGAKVEAVTDPVTGLSIRSRIYYVGNSSEIHVALDVLYGIKTLDPNLAMRMRD